MASLGKSLAKHERFIYAVFERDLSMSWHQFSKYGDENCDGRLLKRHQTNSTEDMTKDDTEIRDHFLFSQKSREVQINFRKC